MIHPHNRPTPNGWEAALLFEETGPTRHLRDANSRRGERFPEEILAIHPDNRVAAGPDHEAKKVLAGRPALG